MDNLHPSHRLKHPISQSEEPACEDAVQDYRSCDGKDLTADAEDLSFLFEFYSRGGYGIGKSCDGNQSTCPTEFYDGRVNVKSGQKHAGKYQD